MTSTKAKITIESMFGVVCLDYLDNAFLRGFEFTQVWDFFPDLPANVAATMKGLNKCK